jgi:hypothetical protein
MAEGELGEAEQHLAQALEESEEVFSHGLEE